jgi:heptosyltransferase-3
MRKIVLYIVYGDNQEYYDGAKFSILTFKNWYSEKDMVEIVVLTEKPKMFQDAQIKVLKMNDKQKKDWSLNGNYHFRIKNRGLGFVMDKLELVDGDKIIFFDADTYFHKSPMPLFDLIRPDQAVFYLNEGLIYKRKRFDIYVKYLEGKNFEIEGQRYKLSKKSALWGSLMVGIMPNMKPSLDWADKLMLKFYELVPSHTIEPFSLSETLLKKYKIVEGKEFVSLYSTSRKRQYVKKVLSNFFEINSKTSYVEKIRLAQTIKLKRPIRIVLKQRILHLLKNND